MDNKRIVIIGAGPCGLGAGWRLKELGHNDWRILEKNPYPGGLSASFLDAQGFTWDIGGHVIFSHYEYFDRLLDSLLDKDYLRHQRRAYVRIFDRWVPYPFQNNIRYLPPDKLLSCLIGLIQAGRQKKQPADFQEWLLAAFGQGITEYFLGPQNSKTWQYPLRGMSYGWIGERVSPVNLAKVLGNIILCRDDAAWGPNNTFKFPLKGGTGAIFSRLAEKLSLNVCYNKELVKLDLDKKELFFSDASRERYDRLITTIPLDHLVRLAGLNRLAEISDGLAHNSVLSVGIGLKGACPSDKCWMYFPQADVPFYRATYFSNYSPNNARAGCYSLMCETAFRGERPSDAQIVTATIDGLIKAKMLAPGDKNSIVSTHCIEAPYAYPVPTLGRDRALREILPSLEQRGVYSRGRFGAFKYETGNMDHCLMQGVAAVDEVLK